MPSIRDQADRAALLARLDRLTAESTRQWGRMTVTQMLSHLCDSARMTLGDLPVKPKHMPLVRHFPLKHLIIYVLPFPKGTPTAPELQSSVAESFDGERERLKRLVARLDPKLNHPLAPEHPLFGPMSATDWGVLAYRHFDHHLRQFGV